MVSRFPALKRAASSSAASWMSNAGKINTWKSLNRVTRHNPETRGPAPPEKVAKINKGGGRRARANMEDVLRAGASVGSKGGQWGGWKGSTFTFSRAA